MNNLIKKGVVVAVIILFLSMSVIPSTGTNKVEKSSTVTFDGEIFYVGGSGPNNYTKIQDAIDNASDGDTVFVYNGTYVENLIIRKSINLVGENRETTIIDSVGKDSVIWIKSSEVNVCGFTIKNSTKDNWGTGIHIENPPTSDIYYVTIHNNIIIQNSKGIRELGNSHTSIHNNIFSNNNLGIELYATEYSSVYENLIINNSWGIYILRAFSNIVINNNQIVDNEFGLLIENSKTTIKCNNFIDNNNHIQLVKIPPLSSISRLLYWRQRWINNYYDKWTLKLPKPIFGKGGLYVTIIKYPILLAIFPYVEIDLHPAQEPYDIGV